MSGFVRTVVVAVLLAGAVFGFYRPSVGYVLISDDYQWLQHARAAIREPLLLVADLDTMWRPLVTWSLALDVAVWDRWMPGYRLSNLLVHVLAALALYGVARRCDLTVVWSTLVAMLWALSPYAAEPAYQVSSRVENLLFLSWAGMLALWPRDDRYCSWGRRLVLGSLVLAAAATKETWVVTPAIVLAAEWGLRGKPWRQALRPALVTALLVGLYALYYALAFGTKRGVYRWAPNLLAKVPHQLAAFCYLDELVPISFPLSWRGLLAVAAVAGLGWWLLRRGRRTTAVGLALLVLPSLPTLFVPFLPTRYTAVPYAGFVLLAACGLAELGSRMEGVRRKVLVAVSALVVVLVLAAGVTTVRADLQDIGRVAAVHGQLLREARATTSRFPVNVPVVFVRSEQDNPLGPIAASPQGLWKLHYPRPGDPYGLVDVAALFDWVMDEPGVYVRELRAADSRAALPGPVLLHRRDGFAWLPPRGPAGDTLALFRSQRAAAKLIIAESPP